MCHGKMALSAVLWYKTTLSPRTGPNCYQLKILRLPGNLKVPINHRVNFPLVEEVMPRGGAINPEKPRYPVLHNGEYRPFFSFNLFDSLYFS